LQAAGENVVFGGFRRCNPLKPAIFANCPCFRARCGGNRASREFSGRSLLRKNYSGITFISAEAGNDAKSAGENRQNQYKNKLLN
jgi:hypothetical protein